MDSTPLFIIICFRILITEANTGIKNSVKYYGEGMHLGAHVPINLGLINDINKDSDARDYKYIVDRWLTYKPLKKQANWMVCILKSPIQKSLLGQSMHKSPQKSFRDNIFLSAVKFPTTWEIPLTIDTFLETYLQ